MNPFIVDSYEMEFKIQTGVRHEYHCSWVFAKYDLNVSWNCFLSVFSTKESRPVLIKWQSSPFLFLSDIIYKHLWNRDGTGSEV